MPRKGSRKDEPGSGYRKEEEEVPDTPEEEEEVPDTPEEEEELWDDAPHSRLPSVPASEQFNGEWPGAD